MRWKTRLPTRTFLFSPWLSPFVDSFIVIIVNVIIAVYQDSGVAQRSEDIAKNPTDEIIQHQASCCWS